MAALLIWEFTHVDWCCRTFRVITSLLNKIGERMKELNQGSTVLGGWSDDHPLFEEGPSTDTGPPLMVTWLSKTLMQWCRMEIHFIRTSKFFSWSSLEIFSSLEGLLLWWRVIWVSPGRHAQWERIKWQRRTDSGGQRWGILCEIIKRKPKMITMVRDWPNRWM